MATERRHNPSYLFNPVRKPKGGKVCKACGWVRFAFKRECPRCEYEVAREFDTATKIMMSEAKSQKENHKVKRAIAGLAA